MPKEPQQQPLQTSKEPTEETLEFLKREEVRTMAKDIAKVRAKEATKERDRIAGLKKEAAQEKKPEVVLSQQPSEQKESQQEQPKKPLLPRRPLKRSEKLFIRLVIGGTILFLIFNAIAFGFWYFFQRQAEIKLEPEDIIVEEQVETPVIPAVLEPEPEIPAPNITPVAFFEIPQQELLLGNSNELLQKLETLLSTPPAPGFLNIVVKTQLGILSTKEFLLKAAITMPLNLKEKLTENTMLFSYYKDNKKRLGIIFELKETEGVSEQIQSWEQTLEQDTTAFFNIIGKKGSAYSSFFRSSAYQGVPVRFQTFSVIDFGIVYGVIDNKLIFTSSFESFQRVVDKLKEEI